MNKREKSFLRVKWSFTFKKLSLLQPGILNAKFRCMKLAQWVWEEDFKISSMYFYYFIIISPWKRVWPFIWIPCTQGCFLPSFVEILEKLIFKFRQIYFGYLVIISPWKWWGPSTEQMYPHYPTGLLCQVWLKVWPSGSGGEDENVKSLQQQQWQTTEKL